MPAKAWTLLLQSQTLDEQLTGVGGSDSDATEGPGAGARIRDVAADPGAMLAMRLDADENTRVLAKANPGEVGGTASIGTVMGACAGVYFNGKCFDHTVTGSAPCQIGAAIENA